MKKILCLDLSTTSTGWALFQNGILQDQNIIKPKILFKGQSKLKYPANVYYRIKSISSQVKVLYYKLQPDFIYIEEINRGINRIAQKSLDALHFLVLLEIASSLKDELGFFNKIKYIDSNGRDGWRTRLKMRLSQDDKKANKIARAFNKKNIRKIKTGKIKKKSIVDWKTLSIQMANNIYGLELKQDRSGDNDIADAICMGISQLY